MKVKDCNNCPFRVDEYDDFSMGYDNLSYCNLAKHQNKDKYIIEAYNQYESKDWIEESEDDEMMLHILKTPNWCPLKEGNISIELEEINK